MRLIDRDAIHWRPDENWELYATAADIRAIPIVDAVVVTRCKDCKYSAIVERYKTAALEEWRAKNHPWRNLWAWVKRKMGCKA